MKGEGRGNNSWKVIFSQSVSRNCASRSPFAPLAQAASRERPSVLLVLSLLQPPLILSLIAGQMDFGSNETLNSAVCYLNLELKM